MKRSLMLVSVMFALACMAAQAGSNQPVNEFTVESIVIDDAREVANVEGFGLALENGTKVRAASAQFHIEAPALPRVMDLEDVSVRAASGNGFSAAQATYYPELRTFTTAGPLQIDSPVPVRRANRSAGKKGGIDFNQLMNPPGGGGYELTCQNGEIHIDGVGQGTNTWCMPTSSGSSWQITCNPTGTGAKVEQRDQDCPVT